MPENFLVYNPRSEVFAQTRDLRKFVADVNFDSWDVVVKDVVKSERFLGLNDASFLLDFEGGLDGDDGYMVACHIMSYLSDLNINYSVAFNEETGVWGVLVECCELVFHQISLGSVVRDKETGEQVFNDEIEGMLFHLDQTIENIVAGA